MIEFTSRRLAFRQLQVEDVTDAYVGWMNDPEITRDLEVRFAHQDQESVQEFVRTQLENPDSYLMRISLNDFDLHIGNIKLGPINRNHQSAQISLLIGERDQHGKGLATEAIMRLTRWGFDTLGLERIEAGCYEDNLGSLRAFLKAGYSVEGFRRKAVIAADGRRIGSFWFSRLASD